MSLPRDTLLEGSRDPEGLQALIDLATQVLRTWQPAWSGFIDAPLQEEALERLGSLSELRWQPYGGHPAAERCRLLCRRANDDANDDNEEPVPIQGLRIEGNFLFDPLRPSDLRQALLRMRAMPWELGDLWVRGDRGGQALCSPECAALLHGQRGRVRDVEIVCESVAIDALQLPSQRAPRQLSSVEASCRLDAIASAGFGLSRAKVVSQIKAGRLRLNWQAVKQPSRELHVGDRLQLQDRGQLEVLSMSRTKRERWRVEMRRT